MKMDYISLLKKFKKHKILVIGDFIMDVYLQGNCTRLAPEASVPVVDVVSKKYCLGGAANAAANLNALGCEVMFLTVIGNDSAAVKAKDMLNEAGIVTDFIVSVSDRSTLVKTRVNASHTLLRYDEGTDTLISAAADSELINKLNLVWQECDAVLIADYNKGTLSQAVIMEMKKLQLNQYKFIGVDSKRIEIFAAIRPSLIKPNYEEALKLLSLPYSGASRIEQLKPFGSHFFKKTNAALIALTLDSDGAIFFKQGEFVHRSLASKIEHPNVSGAGDTFISTCLLALISGTTVSTAANVATAAAGIAIAKNDTAICYGYELANVLTAGQKHIQLLSLLKYKCKLYKAANKKIIFTNGCFDILHSSHVNYLQRAKETGDILIVGVNNDESIQRLKGKNRPVNSLQDRIAVLSALGCVDYIVPFGCEADDTPVQLIKAIHPDVFVKGGAYKNKLLPETKLLRRIGCKTVFLPEMNNQSTAGIINRMNEGTVLNIAIAN